MKVLVKIFTIIDDDEGEILRQFTVEGKKKTPGALALKIGEILDEELSIYDVEAWMEEP